jgi:hypothetical protein
MLDSPILGAAYEKRKKAPVNENPRRDALKDTNLADLVAISMPRHNDTPAFALVRDTDKPSPAQPARAPPRNLRHLRLIHPKPAPRRLRQRRVPPVALAFALALQIKRNRHLVYVLARLLVRRRQRHGRGPAHVRDKAPDLLH